MKQLPRTACPICRGPACVSRVAAGLRWVECAVCTPYTITIERVRAFDRAWASDDRETLMMLESLSAYLRHEDDDGEREISERTWLECAIDGQHIEDDES